MKHKSYQPKQNSCSANLKFGQIKRVTLIISVVTTNALNSNYDIGLHVTQTNKTSASHTPHQHLSLTLHPNE